MHIRCTGTIHSGSEPLTKKKCVAGKRNVSQNPVVHMDEVAPNTARESVEAIAFLDVFHHVVLVPYTQTLIN